MAVGARFVVQDGQHEREHRPASDLALDRDVAAEQPREPARQRAARAPCPSRAAASGSRPARTPRTRARGARRRSRSRCRPPRRAIVSPSPSRADTRTSPRSVNLSAFEMKLRRICATFDSSVCSSGSGGTRLEHERHRLVGLDGAKHATQRAPHVFDLNVSMRTSVRPASIFARSSQSFTRSDERIGRVPHHLDRAAVAVGERALVAIEQKPRDVANRIERRANLVIEVGEETRLELVHTFEVRRRARRAPRTAPAHHGSFPRAPARAVRSPPASRGDARARAASSWFCSCISSTGSSALDAAMAPTSALIALGVTGPVVGRRFPITISVPSSGDDTTENLSTSRRAPRTPMPSPVDDTYRPSSTS